MQYTWPVVTLSLLSLVPQAVWGDCIESPPPTVANPIVITCTGPSVLPTLNVPGPTAAVATGANLRIETGAVLTGAGVVTTADADHGALGITNAGRIERAGASAISATGQGRAAASISNSGTILGSTSVSRFTDQTLSNADDAIITGAVTLDAIDVQPPVIDPPEVLTNPAGTRTRSTLTAQGGRASLDNAGTIDAGNASVLVSGVAGAELTNRGSIEGDIVAPFVDGVATFDAATERRSVSESRSEVTTVGDVTTAVSRNSNATSESSPTVGAAARLANANGGSIVARTIVGARSEFGDALVENAAGAAIEAGTQVFSGAADQNGLRNTTSESSTTTVDTVSGAVTRRVQTNVGASTQVERAPATVGNATLRNDGGITTPLVVIAAEGGGEARLENAGQIRADASGFGQALLSGTSQTRLLDTSNSSTVVTTTPNLSTAAARTVSTHIESSSNSRVAGGNVDLRNAATGNIDAQVSIAADGDAALSNAGTIVGSRVEVTSAGVFNGASTSVSDDVRVFDGTPAQPSVTTSSTNTLTAQQNAGGAALLDNAAGGNIGTDAERVGQVRVEGDAGAELRNSGDVRSNTTLEVVARGQFNREVRTEAQSADAPQVVTTSTPDAQTTVVRTQDSNSNSSTQTQTLSIEESDASLLNAASGVLEIDGDVNVTTGAGARFGTVSDSSNASMIDRTVTTREVPGDAMANPVVSVNSETQVGGRQDEQSSASRTEAVFSGGTAALDNAGTIEALRDVNVRGERGARVDNSGTLEADDLVVQGGATGVEIGTENASRIATPNEQANTTSSLTVSQPTTGAATTTTVNDGTTTRTIFDTSNEQRTARRAVSGDAVVENSGTVELGGQIRVSAGETLSERSSSSSNDFVVTDVDDDVTRIDRDQDFTERGITEDRSTASSSSASTTIGSGVAVEARVENSGVLQVARTIDILSIGGGDAAFAASGVDSRSSSQTVTVDARTGQVVVEGESAGSSESERITRNEFDNRSAVDSSGNTTTTGMGDLDVDFSAAASSSSREVRRDIGGGASYANEGEANVAGGIAVRGNQRAGFTTGVGSTTVVRDDIVVEASAVTQTTTSSSASESTSSDQRITASSSSTGATGFQSESTSERELAERSSASSSSSVSRSVDPAAASLVADGALSARVIRVQGNGSATVRNGLTASDAQQDMRGTQLNVSASSSAGTSANEASSTSSRDLAEQTSDVGSNPATGAPRQESQFSSQDAQASTSSSSATSGSAGVAGNALVENGGRMQFNSVSVTAGGVTSSERNTNSQNVQSQSALDRTSLTENGETRVTETSESSSDTTIGTARSVTQSGVEGNATVTNSGELLAPTINVVSTGGGDASIANSGRITATSPSSIVVEALGSVTNGSSESSDRTRVNGSSSSDSDSPETNVTESTTQSNVSSTSNFTTADIGGDASLSNAAAGVIGHQVNTDTDLITVRAGGNTRLDNQGLIDADATVQSVGRSTTNENTATSASTETRRTLGTGESTFAGENSGVTESSSSSESTAGTASITNGAAARTKGELTARSEGGASIVNAGFARRVTASTGGDVGATERTSSMSTTETSGETNQTVDDDGVLRSFESNSSSQTASESESRGVRSNAEVTNSGVVAPFELKDFPGSIDAGRIESSTLLSSVIGGAEATLRNTATGTIIGNVDVQASALDTTSSSTSESEFTIEFAAPPQGFSDGSQVFHQESVSRSSSTTVGGTARVVNAGAIGLELEAPGGARPSSNFGGVVDAAGGTVQVDNSGVIAGVLTARGLASDSSSESTVVSDSTLPFGNGVTGPTVTTTRNSSTTRSGDGDNGAIAVNNTGTLVRGVRLDGRGTGELSFVNTGTLGDIARSIVASVELTNRGSRDVVVTEQQTDTTRDAVEQVTTFVEAVTSERDVLMKDVEFSNAREVNASFSLSGGNAEFANTADGDVRGNVFVDALLDAGETSATQRTERTTAQTLATGVTQMRSETVTEHREEHAVGGDASVVNAGNVERGVTARGLRSATVDNGDEATIGAGVSVVSRARDRVRDANTTDGFTTNQTTVGGVAALFNAGSIGAQSGGSVAAFGAAQTYVENDGVVRGGILAGSRLEHDWVNTVNDEAVGGPTVTYAAAAAFPDGARIFDPFAHAAIDALVTDGDLVRRTGNALLGNAFVVNEFEVGGDVVVGGLGLSALVNDGTIDDDVAMAAFVPRPDSDDAGETAGFVNHAGGINVFVNRGIVRGDVLFAGAKRAENAASSSFAASNATSEVGGDSLFVVAAGASVLGTGSNGGPSPSSGDCGGSTAICFDVDESLNTLRLGDGSQIGIIGGGGFGGIRFGGIDSSNLLEVGTGARIYGDIAGATDALRTDRSDTRLVFDVGPSGATEYSYSTRNVASLDKTGAGSLVLNRFVEKATAAPELQQFSHDIARINVTGGALVVGKFVVTDGKVVPLADFIANSEALQSFLSVANPNATVASLEELDRDYRVLIDGQVDVAAAGTLMGDASMTDNLTNAGRLLPGALVRRENGPLSNLTSADDQLVMHGELHMEGNFQQSATGRTTVYAAPALGRTVTLPDAQVPELDSAPVFRLSVSPWAPVRDPELATGRIVVDGNATMAGQLEVLTAENALYREGDRYDFLAVSGTASTTGLTVAAPGSSSLVRFTPTTRTEGGKTIVSATVDRQSYATVLPAGDGNRQELAAMLDESVNEVVQRLVANQFNNVAEFNEVQNMATTLAGLDRMAVTGGITASATGNTAGFAIAQAFDELNGGVLATLSSVDPGRNFLAAIDRRVAGLESGGPGDRISRGESPASVWAQPIGWNEELDSDGDYVGVDVDGRGYSVGADFGLGESGVLIGLAAAKTSADVASDSGPAANADFDTLSVGTYVSTRVGAVRIDGSIASITSDVESRRQLPLFGGAADAEFDVDEIRVGLGASYDFNLSNGTTITPSIDFTYRSRDMSSFSEEGVGGVGLVVDGLDESFLTTTLGVTAQRSWRFGELAVTPIVGLQVRFEGEDVPELEARMRGSNRHFTIEGVERDTLFMPHAGVVLRYGKSVEVYLNGSGAYGSDQSGWNVLGGIRIGL